MIKYDEMNEPTSCWNKAGITERVFALLEPVAVLPQPLNDAELQRTVRMVNNGITVSVGSFLVIAWNGTYFTCRGPWERICYFWPDGRLAIPASNGDPIPLYDPR